MLHRYCTGDLGGEITGYGGGGDSSVGVVLTCRLVGYWTWIGQSAEAGILKGTINWKTGVSQKIKNKNKIKYD
jgi:hypothetical protein